MYSFDKEMYLKLIDNLDWIESTNPVREMDYWNDYSYNPYYHLLMQKIDLLIYFYKKYNLEMGYLSNSLLDIELGFIYLDNISDLLSLIYEFNYLVDNATKLDLLDMGISLDWFFDGF